MTSGRFTLHRLLVALAVAAMLFFGLSPAAWSQDDTDESSRSAAPSSGRAVIPDFYPVDVIPTGGQAGLDLDPDTGFLWSSDAVNTVTIYDHAGNVIDSFGTAGSGDGQFNGADGIAISEGEAFVVDQENDRVQVLNAANPSTHLRNITGGGVDRPCAVEVVDDIVYVGSAGGQDTVYRYSRNGSFLDSFNGSDSGTTINPGCDTDFLASDGNEIFLGDWFNGRVAVFDKAGNWLRDINTGGAPAAIDADRQGNVWFADFSNSTVETWTTAGVFVGQFDTAGSALGELSNPQAIVADNSGASFWVGESGNNRIQIFTMFTCDGLPLTHVGTSFSDTLTGTSGADVAHLGKGFDNFNGGAGDDVACGANGQDEFNGGGGDDILLGGNGNDTLLGGSGNDVIDGRQGIDNINGNGGNDTLIGSNGFDEVKGGGGDDLLRGAMGNDLLIGGAGSDEANGGQGIDDVRGGGGDDDVNGQNGNDKLNGGTGSDVCRGGNGTDTGNACEVTVGIP